MRLTPLGAEIGLATEERVKAMESKRAQRDALIEWCSRFTVKMGEEINRRLSDSGTSPLASSVRLVELIKRPQLDIPKLSTMIPALASRLEQIEPGRRDEIVEAAEILIKYGGYIQRERELAEKTMRLEYVKLPESIDYSAMKALSTEARQKLDAIRPGTIGQASRIPGVSPSDVSILLVLLGR